MLPDLHTGFSRGRSGGLVFLSLSEFSTVYCDPRKGFGIFNKAETDVFVELSCFFDHPADVGNLISAFSKMSLNICKFMVHRQLYIYMQKKEDEPLLHTIEKIKSTWIMHLITTRTINSIHERCLHTCLFLRQSRGGRFSTSPQRASKHELREYSNPAWELGCTYRHGSHMKQNLRIGTAISNAYTGTSSEKVPFLPTAKLPQLVSQHTNCFEAQLPLGQDRDMGRASLLAEAKGRAQL